MKLKSALLLTIGMIQFAILSAQTTVNIFHSPFILTKVKPTLDGNYISVGICDTTGGFHDFLIKSEPDGDIIWQTLLDLGYMGHFNIFPLADGNYIVIDGSRFMKVDAGGTEIFSHTFMHDDMTYTPIVDDAGVYYGLDAVQNSDGILMLGSGSTWPGSEHFFILTQLNNDGDIISCKTTMYSEGSGYYGNLADTLGRAYFSIYSYADFDIHLIAIDKALATIDVDVPTSGGSASMQLHDGFLYTTGETAITTSTDHLMKVDMTGSPQWNKSYTYPITDSSRWILGTAELPGHSIALSYRDAIVPFVDYGIFVILYNADGDTIFNSGEILDGNHFLVNDFSCIGNSLCFTGEYDDAGDQSGFILITDTLGHFGSLNIEGHVYNDANGNGIMDPGEYPLADQFVHTTDDIHYAVTDSTGLYDLNLYWEGDYTETLNLPEYWDLVDPAEYDVVFDAAAAGTVVTGNDFRLNYTTPVTDLYVSINPEWEFRQDWNTWIISLVKNMGNQVIPAGTLEFKFDGDLDYVDGYPYAGFTDSTITYAYSELNPGESSYFITEVYTPIALSIGTPLNFTAYAEPPAGDIDPGNNADTINTIVRGPYDPNFKVADPVGEGPEGYIDPETDYIEYTINFQNIGDAPAINVTVSDTIDADLGWMSLQMLAASDAYRMELTAPNIITWHFDNINLPDSATDEQGSHGFIIYRIRIKDGSPIGTVINNSANIYFDYNSAVITNTTINTLGTFVESIEEENILPFTIQPNPSSDYCQLYFSSVSSATTIQLTDLNGRIIEQFESDPGSDHVQFNTKSLANGLYLVRMNNKNGVGTRSLVVSH